jgi:magnesium-protoporphyrin O-methyltransferase
MSTCCSPRAYSKLFSAKEARRNLRRYRKKGLPPDALWAVETLRTRGIAGAAVLEVGGGIGAVQVELLDAGAEHVVNVELSPEYEDAAAELRRDNGVRDDRVERVIGDFVERADELPQADAVVMMRVVCCYPDAEALLRAAARKATQYVVFSFPPWGIAGRAGVRVINLVWRIRRCDFRSFAHDGRAMRDALEGAGFRLTAFDKTLVWRTAAFERAG